MAGQVEAFRRLPRMQRMSLAVGMMVFMNWANSVNASSMLDGLTSCLTTVGVQNFTTIESNSTLYYRLLRASILNMRFAAAQTPKPSALIFPRSNVDVQNAVRCSTANGWTLRVRCGGHSYEGSSYTADTPFVVIDMVNMDAVRVDLRSKTAWVEGGATLGQIYYAISQETSEYGFPAGSCPTVGSGGHISGGGFGFLSRKYGLASDNIVDAQFVDAMGNLLDRHTMGKDVFWALEGGGGGSWGVVVAWKIKLVPVPPILTVCRTTKTGMESVTNLVHRWQRRATSAPQELFLSIFLSGVNQTGKGMYHYRGERIETTDISATFSGQYLGRLPEALSLITSVFPELSLSTNDCNEMSWIQSVFYFSGIPNKLPLSSLANRYYESQIPYFKAKSDYIITPVPRQALKQAFRFLEESHNGYVIFDPYGGRMAEIPSNATAFPHRDGTLYGIQYAVASDDAAEQYTYLAWLQKFYDFMAPYVSQTPRRAAYVNYQDFDLGAATNGTATVAEARKWGESYFQGNFERLVEVKTKIDPQNFFRHPQSIPPATV